MINLNVFETFSWFWASLASQDRFCYGRFCLGFERVFMKTCLLDTTLKMQNPLENMFLQLVNTNSNCSFLQNDQKLDPVLIHFKIYCERFHEPNPSWGHENRVARILFSDSLKIYFVWFHEPNPSSRHENRVARILSFDSFQDSSHQVFMSPRRIWFVKPLKIDSIMNQNTGF